MRGRGSRSAWSSCRRWIAAALALLLASGCAGIGGRIDPAARDARAREDLARLYADAPTSPPRLDLWTAMARAVQHNLERRVALLDEALASRRLGAARLELLPDLVASTEYYGRNNEHGAVSESLLTGRTSLEPSTSQERYGWRSNLTLAWSVLDFGVSWIRAEQQADLARVAGERREKATQDLLLDVRAAFFRAAAAERLLPQLGELETQVRDALETTRDLEERRLLAPLAALEYRRSLLDRMRDLRGLRRELDAARIELARLTQLRPGTPLALELRDPGELPLPEVDLPLARLEDVALRLRPELREQDHRARVQRLEARRALLSMLPGIELAIGRHEDSNAFLFNEDWWSTSALLTQNLMQLVSGAGELRVARAEQDLAEARRLALSAAVLAQVNLAYQELATARASHATASELLEVEARLHGVTGELVAVERESELEFVRKHADHRTAELRQWLAYADLQEAYGRLLHAVGVRSVVDDAALIGTQELATRLRRSFDTFRRQMEIARDYPEAELAATGAGSER